MNLDVTTLSFVTELVGTVAFSISGAMLAIERKLDLFGVLFLGVITAIGGGIVRDLLLGQIPPKSFQNYVYLTVAVLSALGVFLICWNRNRVGRTMEFIDPVLLNVLDAAGLGIFSVVGVQNTMAAGFADNAFFCIFLGMTTGVGGGMLRDVLSRATPAVLRKHIYAIASILGAMAYYYLLPFGMTAAILISTLLVVILRVLASHYKWTLPRIVPDRE